MGIWKSRGKKQKRFGDSGLCRTSSPWSGDLDLGDVTSRSSERLARIGGDESVTSGAGEAQR